MRTDFARHLARGATAHDLVPLLVWTGGSSRLVMQTHLLADRHRFCPVCVVIQGSSTHARVREVMSHQQHRLSWDAAKAAGGEGGNKYERRPEFLVSVGPLSVAPFSSVRLVFAEVMGEMDRAKIVEGGVANIDLMAIASRDSLLAHVRAARSLYARAIARRCTPHPP